jgi:hypothetical protein
MLGGSRMSLVAYPWAVLEWVRTHKLSLRRGAELLQMTYHSFLMAREQGAGRIEMSRPA